MAKFELRVVFNVPFWGYTEVEAETLEDAVGLIDDNTDFDIDFQEMDTAPGEPEMDDIFMEVKNADGKWVAVT